MGKRLLGSRAQLVVVGQQLVDQVHHLVQHQVLVIPVDKGGPRLAWVVAQNAVVLGAQLDAVLVHIRHERFRAQHLGNLHQLVVVGVSTEKWLLLEYDGRKHAPHGPEIQGVVVLLEVDEQLWALVVPGGDSDVVVDAGVVELRKTPVNKPQGLCLRVDHDVLRLDVSVDDAHGMRVVQGNEELQKVVLDVGDAELVVQDAEIDVVDGLENQGRDLGVLVSDNVQEPHHIRASGQVLQDLHLSIDFLHFHRLQHLDHTGLVVDHVDTLEHLRVLAPSDLGHNLVVLDVSPLDRVGFIVPVVSRLMLVHIGVYSSHRVHLGRYVHHGDVVDEVFDSSHRSGNAGATSTDSGKVGGRAVFIVGGKRGFVVLGVFAVLGFFGVAGSGGGDLGDGAVFLPVCLTCCEEVRWVEEKRVSREFGNYDFCSFFDVVF